MMIETVLALGALAKVDWLAWFVALGAGAILVEALRSFVQRKKMGADYADVISASAVRLIKPLEERINDLEGKVFLLQSELHTAQLELIEAVENANHERDKRVAAELLLQRYHEENGLHYSD